MNSLSANTTICSDLLSLRVLSNNYVAQRNLHAEVNAWSHEMEGHARNCVERYCELANMNVEQLYKVFTPCFDDHQFKEEALETVGELSRVCSHIVLEC